MSSLYILEIKPLSEVSLANIFSHLVGSLFILLMFSLAMQKVFILMKSHSFVLSFMAPALGDLLVKICSVEYLRFSCLCSPLGLLWCHDIFKAFIHLEGVFFVWCKLVVEFHFFACSCPDLPTPKSLF